MAHLEGFPSMGVADMVGKNELIITCTGAEKVISTAEIISLGNGAILANMGHGDLEIDVQALHAASSSHRSLTSHITEFQLGDRKAFLLAGGSLFNLAAGFGFPIEIIDYSFAAAMYSWVCSLKSLSAAGLKPLPSEADDFVLRASRQRHGHLE
jgi:adenosylhomocysteinase